MWLLILTGTILGRFQGILPRDSTLPEAPLWTTGGLWVHDITPHDIALNRSSSINTQDALILPKMAGSKQNCRTYCVAIVVQATRYYIKLWRPIAPETEKYHEYAPLWHQAMLPIRDGGLCSMTFSTGPWDKLTLHPSRIARSSQIRWKETGGHDHDTVTSSRCHSSTIDVPFPPPSLSLSVSGNRRWNSSYQKFIKYTDWFGYSIHSSYLRPTNPSAQTVTTISFPAKKMSRHLSVLSAEKVSTPTYFHNPQLLNAITCIGWINKTGTTLFQ